MAERIWTKSFISIALTQFLIFTGFYALLTTLPLYVVYELDGTEAEGGLIVTTMLIAAILIRPFSSKILELIGKLKGLIYGTLFFALTNAFYMFADQLVILYIIRFFHGLAFGVVSTVTGALAADIVPQSRRGAGLGYFAMSMNLALVIGPFVGLSILQFTSFFNLFLMLTILLFIAGVTAFLVESPTEKGDTQRKEKISFKLKASDLIEIRALPVALFSGLIGMSYSSILSFVSVYAESLHLAKSASFFFLVFAIVMLASRPSLGRAFDEHGPKVVLVPSLIVFGLGLFLLGLTKTSLMLLLAAGLIGLGYGTVLPGFQTMAVQSTTYERNSHATATFLTFYDLGIGSGSFIWGIVVTSFSFEKMYFLNALLVTITALVFYYYLSRQKYISG